ncbi:hydroxyethylthiazole kinase [Nakamurella sp.]|uniref:hydroxyethylthiazole kinase n=1 Tax=Nakamurella sp. TaxID=1869182 RepID=UPI003B3B4A06
MTAPSIRPADCADALATLRERSPLVQCLTNIVVAQWTANVLLAVGAAPAMVDNPEEAGAFARIAGGVLVNLGTPYADTTAAMEQAVAGATAAGTPWVLDPVAAGALAWRTGIARTLLDERPTVLRGNASEVMALTGGAGGKGVDSVDTPEAALDAAVELAGRHGTVVAISGPVDHLTDGNRVVRVANGHPLLTRVTGVGCALGAMIAGFAAVVPDPLLAAVAATATLTVAGDRAAAAADGPGTFAVALLDRLALLTPDELADRVRLG